MTIKEAYDLCVKKQHKEAFIAGANWAINNQIIKMEDKLPQIDSIVILFFSEDRAMAGCIEKDEEQENGYYFVDPLGDIIEEETWGWPRYWMEVPKLPE